VDDTAHRGEGQAGGGTAAAGDASPPVVPPADVSPPTRAARLRRDLRRGVIAGLQTFWVLTRAMIPAYGIALVLKELGVIDWLAHAASPVMSLLGLPGSTAVPLVVGYFLNIYAAVGAMQALSLSAAQITVLAIAVLIGHNLLVEGAVLRKAGANVFFFTALRVVGGLTAAAVANQLMHVM
jgi:hypothetical protein